MTEHTDGAVRAAKGIWKDGKITLHNDTDYDAFIESATTIIDQKTGLPKLEARLDNLEAETDSWAKGVLITGKTIRELKADRDKLKQSNEKMGEMLQSAIIDIDGWEVQNGEFDVTHEGLRTLRQELEKTLAKEPESGGNEN